MGYEDELWLPPSFKDQKRFKRLPKKRKHLIKGTGFADKTLWDWFQFFGVIAIPFVIAAGTLFITQQQAQLSVEAAQQQAQLSADAANKQHQADQELATDQQNEAALQSYLSDMTDLLLNYHLRESKEGDEVREVARARTLTILSRLDGRRKGAVVQFLFEAQLITGAVELSIPPVISLSGADLKQADLGGVDLFEANLEQTDLTGAYMLGADLKQADLAGAEMSEANLRQANLTGADLEQTDLTGANLIAANLTGADLTGADLTGANLIAADLTGANLSRATISDQQLAEASSLNGATMPDGSTHP